MLKRLNVLVPEKTHRKLKIRASQAGKTMKGELVDIINEATKNIRIKPIEDRSGKGENHPL